MRFSEIILRPLSAGVLIILIGIYIEVPGPYRALTPQAFGLTQVAPKLYIDDPRQAPKALSLLRKAKTNSAAFFGPSKIEPRTIICSTNACKETFGLKALGLAIGYQIVIIAPVGMNERTMTHERAHVDLHAKIGIQNLAFRPYPYWFDEGLASHVAGDNRLAQPRSARDADWIKSATTYGQWHALSATKSAAQVYGAAARLVGEIEEVSGKNGIEALIEHVSKRGDFDEKYRQLIRR